MLTDFSSRLSREHIAARIDFGDDVEFTYNGRRFTILGWYDGGPLIAEVDTGKEEQKQQFKDGSSLLSGYLIDGTPLGDILDRITLH